MKKGKFMKKLISSILIAATLATTATPAMAEHRDRGHRYEERHRGEHRRGGSDAGKIILGILGGAIIAGAIADSDRRDRRYEDRYYDYDPYARDRYTMPPRARYYERYCVTEQMVDRYGDVYFRRTCQ